jgi:hypothetical protein
VSECTSVRFSSIGFAKLDDEVMLEDGVQILSGAHEHAASAPQRRGTKLASVFSRFILVVESGLSPEPSSWRTWVGSVIGAGAVVTEAISDGCVAVEVPAKVVKTMDTRPVR